MTQIRSIMVKLWQETGKKTPFYMGNQAISPYNEAPLPIHDDSTHVLYAWIVVLDEFHPNNLKPLMNTPLQDPLARKNRSKTR